MPFLNQPFPNFQKKVIDKKIFDKAQIVARKISKQYSKNTHIIEKLIEEYGIENVGPGNGTSFSSPVMAGMSTCLWQAYPEKSMMEIQQAIKEKIPTGQFGNPQNIWNAVQFLRESDYVNGANIDMNAAII